MKKKHPRLVNKYGLILLQIMHYLTPLDLRSASCKLWNIIFYYEISPTDYYLSKHLKPFFRKKNSYIKYIWSFWTAYSWKRCWVKIIEIKEQYFDYNKNFTSILLYQFYLWHFMWDNLIYSKEIFKNIFFYSHDTNFV